MSKSDTDLVFEPRPTSALKPSISPAFKPIRIDLTRTAVGEALERARTVALRQLRLFEERAGQGVFTDREASAYQRVVNTLATIEREQRTRVAELDSAGLTDAELTQYEEAARATLGLGPLATARALPAYEPPPADTLSSPSGPPGADGEAGTPTYPKPPKTSR